jgi:uncharacterized protein (TIGR03437 family)
MKERSSGNRILQSGMKIRVLGWLCSLLAAGGWLAGRTIPELCGTYPERAAEETALHRAWQSKRVVNMRAAAGRVRGASRDVGEIAVIEDDGSIVGARNPFGLDRRQVSFQPLDAAAARYRYATSDGGFDAAAGEAGQTLALGDDDARQVELPFAFPFYGASYRQMWVHSDGNVTFVEKDAVSSSRSVGRMNAGPPRIAPLFTDLNPEAGGRVTMNASAGRVTVSWIRVPEYVDFGTGRAQTMQLRMFPDGRMEFAWEGIAVAEGVTGIAPGETRGRVAIVNFAGTASGEYEGMVAERFGDSQEVDLVSAAQKFYETHEDAYDYIAFFNNTGVQPGPGVLAFETTVRSGRLGIGDTAIDIGRQYGSVRRLQAVLNMGPLANYPLDPNAPAPLRSGTGDTGLTVFAHEVGHLFLAFASVRDAANPGARPMLGRQNFHWNFRFNSEASILEGNRIRDNGENVNPRFTTVATVEGFSPLDQYLMGLRAPEEVPATFLVTNASLTAGISAPQVGVNFNGTRRDIGIEEIIAAEGRRIPDHTVEQRRFRMALVLLTAPGGTVRDIELEVLERYRREMEAGYARFTAGRGQMEVTLRRRLTLSAEPSQGALLGAAFPLTVSVERAVTAPLAVNLRLAEGMVSGPATVTIPAGAREATVSLQGVRAGAELITAEAAGAEGTQYVKAEARVRVSAAAEVTLRVESGDRQEAQPGQLIPEPVVVRVSDENLLGYPGLRLRAVVAFGGSVSPAEAVTDAGGRASFRWTAAPVAGFGNVLRVSLAAAPGRFVEALALGAPSFFASDVVNAASYEPGLMPGSIATAFGASLAGARVTVGGLSAPVFFAGDRQVNFFVPGALTGPTTTVRIDTPRGSATAEGVGVRTLHPGVFFDTATFRAAAIDRGSRIFEVYGTGFGPTGGTAPAQTVARVTATVGGRPAAVLFSGLAPGFAGLYQINVQVDPAVSAGEQTLVLEANGIASNSTRLLVR